MNVTVMTFSYDEDFDEKQLRQLAERTRASYEEVPGLRFIACAVDAARRQATNYFIWTSEGDESAFFTPERIDRFAQIYRGTPRIEHAKVLQLVDNGP